MNSFLRTLALIALSASLLGQAPYRSLQTGGGVYGTSAVVVPNAAPWSARTAIRVEWRMDTWGATALGRGFTLGGLSCYVSSAYAIGCQNWFEAGETTSVILPTGTTNAVFRAVINLAAGASKRWWVEAWSPDGTAYYPPSSLPIPTATTMNFSGDLITVGHSGSGGNPLTARIAWLRAYGTAVGKDAAVPTNVTGGDLLSYDFEANGTDTSAQALSLTLAGTPTYPSTPVVPVVGEEVTVRSGASFIIDLSATAADSYAIRPLYTPSVPSTNCPSTLKLGSLVAGVGSGTGLIGFGQCTLLVTATINGVSGSANMIIGYVPTNTAGVVMHPASTTKTLLDEMVRRGMSGYPFYDRNRLRVSKEIGALINSYGVADFNTPCAGTLSVSNSSTAVTGVGTAFTSCYANGSAIVLYYDQGAGVIGRAIRDVTTVVNDTSLTLSANWNKPTQSAIQHQRFGTGDGGAELLRWNEGTNYYDMLLTLYVTYYQSGIKSVADYADSFAPHWWLYLDKGVAFTTAPGPAGRRVGETGLIIAALRGALSLTDVTAALHSYHNTSGFLGFTNFLLERTYTLGYRLVHSSVREAGYNFRAALGLAIAHPDAGTRTTWTTRLANAAADNWLKFQCDSGNTLVGTQPVPYDIGCQFPQGAFRTIDEAEHATDWFEPPWITGVAMQGLIRYHRWNGNASAQTVIQNWVAHLLNNTQPGGIASQTSLYLTQATDFAGVNCRGHYYYHQKGTRSTLYSGTTGYSGGNCAGPPESVYGVRDTNNEMVSSYGYAYRLTGTAAYKTRGDDVFDSTYGASDGFFGGWMRQRSLGVPSLPKLAAQALCCNDSYLVDRMDAADNATSAQNRNHYASCRLASVASADKCRVTLTKPNGDTVVVTGSSGSSAPLTIPVDVRQGEGYLLRYEYLSSVDVVLASGEQQFQ